MARRIRRFDTLIVHGTGSRFQPNVPHLFFVLTDVDDAKKLLIAPVGTRKTNSDPTCCIFPSDHPFITRESFVLYGRVKLADYAKLLQRMRHSDVSADEPMTVELYERVCAGLRASPFSPRWAKRYLGNPPK